MWRVMKGIQKDSLVSMISLFFPFLIVPHTLHIPYNKHRDLFLYCSQVSCHRCCHFSFVCVSSLPNSVDQVWIFNLKPLSAKMAEATTLSFDWQRIGITKDLNILFVCMYVCAYLWRFSLIIVCVWVYQSSDGYAICLSGTCANDDETKPHPLRGPPKQGP